MKAFICLLLVSFFLIGTCNAQDCKYIKKIKSPFYLNYVGIIRIPPDYNNISSNKFFDVYIEKYVTTDTSFFFGISIIAFDASITSNLATITLRFESNSTIIMANQSLHITPMSGGRNLLSTHVRLKLSEILAIRDGSLLSITIANSKVIVPETMSKAIKEVARYLPSF